MKKEDYLRLLDERMETAPRGQAKADLDRWLSTNDPQERINELSNTVARRRWGT